MVDKLKKQSKSLSCSSRIKTGCGSRKVGGKTHDVGVQREKQAEKNAPEANRAVPERKLDVEVEK